jgi:ribosomal protein L20A (L18A)
MKKIVCLPLDERPCNTRYPKAIFQHANLQLVFPNQIILGNKKEPASFKDIEIYLLNEALDADGLIVSIDMLLYGGIVPSRLHYLDEETLINRLSILEKIKRMNPKILIYAFDLIMRCPQYNSSDEEPDYYQYHGKNLFLKGFLTHKKELEIASEEEIKKLNEIYIPDDVYNDFTSRRKANIQMNRLSVELVNQNIIDFLVIPQDDAAQYGFTAKDQVIVKEAIDNKHLHAQIYMYPGADEALNTLISKMYCVFENKKPAIFIIYPSPTSALTIPLLEDRYLDVTVRYQIRAAGGRIVSSISESDIVLFVNANAKKMLNVSKMIYFSEENVATLKNMNDFVEQMKEVLTYHHKAIMVADVATLNGADHQLIQMMQKQNLLLKVSAYAGWNTSSNTLGTTIPMGISSFLSKKENKSFLVSRYIEDYGYMTCVRAKTYTKIHELKKINGELDVQDQDVTDFIKDELVQFVKTYLPTIEKDCHIKRIKLPWKRLFEIDLYLKDDAL